VLRNIGDVLGWAAASPEREVCGVVIDETALLVPNRATGDAQFRMTVDDLRLVPGIERMTGVWHSHPDRFPHPSQEDWELHPDGFDLLIVANGVIRAFTRDWSSGFTRTVWSSDE